jgi:beta-galactosidase
MRDHPEYAGQFLWTGVDYLGESRTWPTLGSGSGLLNSVALPHGRAYERQSWWSTTPMVAMVRRVAAVRAASVDPGYANATSTDQSAAAAPARAAGPPPDPSVRFSEPLLSDWTPKSLDPHVENVDVYTNAQEVELFLNGKSVGTDKLHADASAITFKVPFEPGTLKAVAKSNGKIVATQELKTAGKPARITFTADSPNTPLTPDWNDVRYVTATLVDDAGTRIPDSTTVIHFAADGPASIVAVDNGNFRDLDPYQATQRKVYFGNALALVRATGSTGHVTVTASADGVQPASVTLNVAPVEKEDSLIAMPASSERSF